MKLKLIGFTLLLALFTISCGEYNKILKSQDVMVKYNAAKRYFYEGNYSRAITLFEDVLPMMRGSVYAEDAIYLLAQSHYELKDYVSAAEYFRMYFTSYPRGEYAELARFYSAYSLYQNSTDPRLDQTDTYNAMQQFQDFMELYPQSDKKELAQRAQFELQEKLALKELMAVRLYYNLGDFLFYPFPGGNYLSAVITAQNAMRTYPFSQYREELMYYTFLAKYQMALKSVDEKKEDRYRDVRDEYYAYRNDYPEGRYLREIQRLYENVAKELNN